MDTSALSFQAYSKCERCLDCVKKPNPKNLCYYHKKIHLGLIDEPPIEIPYSDVWVSEDKLSVYLKIAKGLVYDFINDPSLRPDAIQYSAMLFNRCMQSWNEKEGAFYTFAHRSIKNALINFNKQHGRYNNRYLVGIDEEKELSDIDLEADYALKEFKENFYKAIAPALDQMSEREIVVFNDRLLGDSERTQQEIADQFQVDKSTISRDEIKILAMLKGVLTDDGLSNSTMWEM